MDAHNAFLGRRKLEEIRQKKAAEKGVNHLSSSASADSSSLLGRKTNNSGANVWASIQDLEGNNKEQDFSRTEFSEKLQAVEAERNALQHQLNKMEEGYNTSMANLRMEKDAAARAREDLVAQLRIVKKKLQEAEEEQYKAEEDAAALRAEIEEVHRKGERNHVIPSSSVSEHFLLLEQEMATVKIELQDACRKIQQEQQKLAAEQEHVAKLMAERELLKNELGEVRQKGEHQTSARSSENSAGELQSTDTSKVKSSHEHQVRELASMIERLENGRQKLLTEIDAQSLEIERLFVENTSLATGLKEATELTAQWEHQVKECLELNAVLRAELNDIRTNQAQIAGLQHSKSLEDMLDTERVAENAGQTSVSSESMSTENFKLKIELAKTKGQAEALRARVLQLSADLNRAMQYISNLNWLYKPVLTNIENRLLQLKQHGDQVDVLLS